jgi:hypothetical protein
MFVHLPRRGATNQSRATPWGSDNAAKNVHAFAPQGQRAIDEQARHDLLAGTGIIGEQEAQWLAG